MKSYFFDVISGHYPQFRYVACENHQEYTERDSGKRELWASRHYSCDKIRFYDKAPAGFEPCLDELEALASVSGLWAEDGR